MEYKLTISYPTAKRMSRLVIFFSFVILSCAEIAPPPGGEIDKTPPILIGSTPLNGAVNVEPGKTITLYFSERIVPPQTKKAVFISPRQTEKPKIKWKSDHIIITLASPFKKKQTYIVSISSDIKDLRNNGLDSSNIVAFSTGDVIDSGKVSGYIFTDDNPQQGTLVGLYDSMLFENNIPLDSVYPQYITQSNTHGYFSFQYLPTHKYQLIAFSDKNHNERFNINREEYAVPDRPVTIGGKLPLDSLNLSLTKQDTAKLQITSAKYSADRLVQVTLSQEIDLRLLRDQPSNLVLRKVDDTNSIFATCFLESFLNKSSNLHFYTNQLKEGFYNIQLTYDTQKPAVVYDSLPVTIQEDRYPPQLIQFNPDNKPQFLQQLKLEAYFSEPIDTSHISDKTFTLWDSQNKNVPLISQWIDPFHIVFNSQDFTSGEKYQFKLVEADIFDMSGNAMGDSVKYYPVILFDNDSLGSVSGKIDIQIPNKKKSPVVLKFFKIGNNRIFSLPVPENNFKINLPAGKYVLSGFIDSDKDGMRGKGSIFPFHFSETYATYPDTIDVRARFETADVNFIFK